LTEESNNRDVLARRILQYLLEHPAAADSASGVRHWWLHGENELAEGLVSDVLDAMARRGWLVTRGRKSEMRIYGFNERCKRDAMRFIENTGEHLNG
jgi:hypothetical protein